MEKFQELREVANKKIKIAEHILTQTYPLVKDPKLLLAVIENIFLAMTNSMGSLLHYELLFKRVPSFQDNFSSKVNIFKSRCMPHYNIDNDYLKLMKELKETIIQHRKSPVEFVKGDKLVICSDSYNMRTVFVDGIREYLNKAKLFIQEASNIVAKNEGIFVNKKRPSF